MHPCEEERKALRARDTIPTKRALKEWIREKHASDSIAADDIARQSSPRRVSDTGASIVATLIEKPIFKDWVQTICAEDPRYPVIKLFEDTVISQKEHEDNLVHDNREGNDTMKTRFLKWASSFRRSDPRFQILQFFNHLAQEGSEKLSQAPGRFFTVPRKSKCPFDRASIFSVWRPTSIEAIKKLMMGQAVGKGLDIKGKSAKKGKLAGFVPFLQAHEDRHKRSIRSLHRDSKVRIFYSTKEARECAAATLASVAELMMNAVHDARIVLNNGCSGMDHRHETAVQIMQWDMADPNIDFMDDYCPTCFGMDVPERLLWEAYVIRQDCRREPGSDYDAGRISEPAFQDMNIAALRNSKGGTHRRTVLWQNASEQHPMCPQNLLMAYEEDGRVVPVVSDFDCFLVGTRRMPFGSALPPEQVELMKWSVEQIEKILEDESPSAPEDTWTLRWLERLKEEAENGFHPEIPAYGFGDPSSYSIMGTAVKSLEKDGCVRHGAECFNYYFPQELDEKYLVISNTPDLGGNLRWKYVNPSELQDILCRKIEKGFTFPLNLKWVLCDEGWKRVYDKLMASQKLYVQKSLNVWFPKESGIRDLVEHVYARHPMGFQREPQGSLRIRRNKRKEWIHQYSPLRQSIKAGLTLSGTTAMDLAKLELKHHVSLKRAKCKLPAAISFLKLQQQAAKCPEETKENLNPIVLRRFETIPFPRNKSHPWSDTLDSIQEQKQTQENDTTSAAVSVRVS